MEKAEVLWMLAGLSFISILFTPIDSEMWKGFLFFGVIFAAGWWWKS